MHHFIILHLSMLFCLAPIPAAQAADIEANITIAIDGMTCESCAQSMKTIFSKETATQTVKVDLNTQTITIDTKDNQTISDDKIQELVNWGGYKLLSIQREK